MKAYQPHSNFLILANIWPCKPLMKISSFWFSDSIFQITNSFPTCCLNQWYFTAMCFDEGVVLVLVATTMAPLFSSYKVDLDTNFSFSLSITKLSFIFLIISLIRIFKGRSYLTEWDNATYSECSVEREIYVCIFDTHNIPRETPSRSQLHRSQWRSIRW